MNDDSDDIEKARQGDLAAFERLVMRHQQHIRALAAWNAPRPDMADDLAQETFCEAYRSLGKFSGKSEFKHWLRGIARNLARQQWQTHSKRTRREHDGLAEYVEQLAAREDDAPSIILDQKVDALRVCMKRLMPHSAKLVELRHEQGLGSEEIAKLVGSKATSVRTALMRIHDKLRECVERILRLDDLSAHQDTLSDGGI